MHCATCRCDPGPVCTCGHLDTSHAFRNDRTPAGRKVRTGCTVHAGPKGTPCGCTQFTPKEAT